MGQLLNEARDLRDKLRNRVMAAYAFADNSEWDRELKAYFKADKRFYRRLYAWNRSHTDAPQPPAAGQGGG